MDIIEIGALVSAFIAVITLLRYVIQLITSIQGLITSIDHLKEDMKKVKDHIETFVKDQLDLKRRMDVIEYQLAIV